MMGINNLPQSELMLSSFFVGKYYKPLGHVNYPGAALVADRLVATVIALNKSVTIDRIAAEITAADAGKVVRLGIYRDTGLGYPGALVVDAGTIDAGSATVQEKVINTKLSRGIYWLARFANGVPTAPYLDAVWALVGVPNTHLSLNNGVYAAVLAYAALPDPYPAGATLGNYPDVIGIRIASVDD